MPVPHVAQAFVPVLFVERSVKILRYRRPRPMPPVEFKVVPPTPALARYVHCFWTLRGSASMEPQAIFPDGRMELVFQLGDPFQRVHPDATRETQSKCLLVGQ